MSRHESPLSGTGTADGSLDIEHTNLLVSLCNQQASPFLSLCEIDPVGSGFTWVDLSLIPEKNCLGGVAGLCRVGEFIAACTQSTPTSLVLFDRTGKVKRILSLDRCVDAHSLLVHDEYLYLVSTGTNEIYRIPVHGDDSIGELELFWQYPEVDYDRDAVHLNGITVNAEGRFIGSCFGSKEVDGSGRREGSVFYLDTGEVIHGGLNQPHTPLVAGGRLFFAESAAKRVFVYQSESGDSWVASREIDVPGYARGLALQGDQLLVGVSRARKVSRSRRTRVTESLLSEEAAIIRVDLCTGEQDELAPLGAYAREIYDILLLEPAERALASPHDALVQRVRVMEETIDRYVVMSNNLHLELKAHKEALEVRQKELAHVYQSLSWTVTKPFRSAKKWLRRLAGAFGDRSRVRKKLSDDELYLPTRGKP